MLHEGAARVRHFQSRVFHISMSPSLPSIICMMSFNDFHQFLGSCSYYVRCHRRALCNTVISPSVHLSVQWHSCLGYRHAGCQQLSHCRPPDTCATDVNLPRVERPSAGCISSRHPQGDNLYWSNWQMDCNSWAPLSEQCISDARRWKLQQSISDGRRGETDQDLTMLTTWQSWCRQSAELTSDQTRTALQTHQHSSPVCHWHYYHHLFEELFPNSDGMVRVTL